MPSRSPANQLPRTPANYQPQTPLIFLRRAARVHGDRIAIVHGGLRQTWEQTDRRCRQLASALLQLGLQCGETVAVMLPNTPAMVEVHFGVPLARGVLCCLNTRLDAQAIAFMLRHGEARVVVVDPEFLEVMQQALEILRGLDEPLPVLILADDPLYTGVRVETKAHRYEALVSGGDPDQPHVWPADEWDAISLNYTSGTTGNPKGVVYSHRGAYTNAVSNILEWDLPSHPVYLWVLPMFHCNGWCFPWTVAARAGVNVCLRRVEPQSVFGLIREHRVTHFCGAPIVHNMLIHAPAELRQGLDHPVRAMVAGAAPPAAMIEGMREMGIEITHVYGLTEVYGPAAVCTVQDQWADLPIGDQARLMARQGVPYHLQHDLAVLDPLTLKAVPLDGETIGEVMFRGNIAMKGYLKNPEATAAAFAGGWFHTGDLAVVESDGYVKIKDRSKDIIISGGENISSIEVEDVLYRHPAVMAAAVVAMPDPKWGETPCAFVEVKPGQEAVRPEDLIAHCKAHLAGFKAPRRVVFGPLPKTSTGKIQKFELRRLAKSTEAIDV